MLIGLDQNPKKDKGKNRGARKSKVTQKRKRKTKKLSQQGIEKGYKPPSKLFRRTQGKHKPRLGKGEGGEQSGKRKEKSRKHYREILGEKGRPTTK